MARREWLVAKRILLCLSHSIEEFDQLRLLSGLGYEVASIGGYINPAEPHDPKRPALDIPVYPEVQEAVDALEMDDNLGRAQSRIPEAILEWLGADGIIIFHHYLERLFEQWSHLDDWRSGGGRIVWRTVGQSVASNEERAKVFRDDGLEIVRYSPKEKNIPGYVGEDAMIRFYKDEEEWSGWTGELELVVNITQHLMQRDPFTNYGFWKAATEGLTAQPLGPGSDAIGGPGELPLEKMMLGLQKARCYLYCGTQPASYTLGLIEAMMVGIPTVSIGPGHMTNFPYGPELYEGHELTGISSDDPVEAHKFLSSLLNDPETAAKFSQHQQFRTRKEFGMKPVGAAWANFLG